jgi:hypothetical protein
MVHATTYYASPNGASSGAGNIDSPLNFATATGKLVAGDTLWVRGGTYSSSSKISISKTGNSSAMIHILAYTGETPVFDFRTQPYADSNQGIGISSNYLHIKGFIIQGAGDNGMQVTGSNNTIENCTFRWNCDAGLQMKTGSNNYILNCDSYENFDYKSTNNDSSPNYGGNADGFADKQYTNSGTNTYEGCRSWRNSDDGWDHYQAVSSTVYKNCWCYANGPASYDMTNHIRYATDQAYIDGFANRVITNYGNGNGFKLGGGYTAHNATLTNCISVANKVKGFDQNNNNGVMTIYNCSSYNNAPNYGFSNSTYGTLIITNCVSLTSKSSNSFSCKSVTSTYNSWNTGFSCSTADFASLDATPMTDSRKTDGSLPDITLLHLVAGSGLIDKGTNVGLPYSGTAPDLGAYEYSITSGINDHTADLQLRYYPNPVTNQLSIHLNSETDSMYGLKITSLSGQTVYSGNFHVQAGINTLTADCNLFARGLYICSLDNGQNRVCFKIIR